MLLFDDGDDHPMEYNVNHELFGYFEILPFFYNKVYLYM